MCGGGKRWGGVQGREMVGRDRNTAQAAQNYLWPTLSERPQAVVRPSDFATTLRASLPAGQAPVPSPRLQSSPPPGLAASGARIAHHVCQSLGPVSSTAHPGCFLPGSSRSTSCFLQLSARPCPPRIPALRPHLTQVSPGRRTHVPALPSLHPARASA